VTQPTANSPVADPTPPAMRTNPGPLSSIFSYRPGLRQPAGAGGYLGRVVVELWELAETSFFAGRSGTPGLLPKARAALANPNMQVLPDSPWGTGAIGALPAVGSFHGRVVIELWEGAATIAATVSNSQLLQRAARHLSSIIP
jgi:hypothetical protein